MRVIAGTARGVPLKTVPDMNTRPILDRLKKSLFSMLDAAGLLAERRVADFYSGAGTLGIEALSRGAASCLFVEKRRDAVKLLHENLAKTRLAERADVRCADAGVTIQGLLREAPKPDGRFDLILYDPPFAFSREQDARGALDAELAAAGQLLAPDGRLMLRAEKRTQAPAPAGLKVTRHWTDGPHAMFFFGKAPEPDAAPKSAS